MRNCHANFKLFTQFLSIFSLVGMFTFLFFQLVETIIIGLALAWAVGGHGLRTCKGFQTWCGDNKWRKLAMYSRVIRKNKSSLEPSFWARAHWSWAFGLKLDPNFWAGAGTELFRLELEPNFWAGARTKLFGLELEMNFWAGVGTKLLGWS